MAKENQWADIVWSFVRTRSGGDVYMYSLYITENKIEPKMFRRNRQNLREFGFEPVISDTWSAATRIPLQSIR